jgi:hypothetical protein
MGKLINELGNKYGALTVIEIAKDKNGRTAWLCVCDCGNKKIVRGPDLRKGRITSCGCRLASREKRIIDLTGQVFGELLVLQRDDNNYDRINLKNKWLCRCSCGNVKSITGSALTSGHTRSCGCKSKEFNAINNFIDETGNVYGYLTVIGSEFDNKDGKLKCKCLCQCGNIILVSGTYLRSSNTLSCGCKNPNTSFATIEIEKFLQENNLLYQKEYTFKDLTSEKGKRLRYDFAILNDKKEVIKLLEYDGPQHFQSTEFYGGKEYLMQLQKHDKMKDEYAKNNGIILFRINHTQNLQKKLLEFLKL